MSKNMTEDQGLWLLVGMLLASGLAGLTLFQSCGSQQRIAQAVDSLREARSDVYEEIREAKETPTCGAGTMMSSTRNLKDKKLTWTCEESFSVNDGVTFTIPSGASISNLSIRGSN